MTTDIMKIPVVKAKKCEVRVKDNDILTQKIAQRIADELLLVTAVNHILKYGGTEFCLLIVDIKSKSPPKGLQYGEAVTNNPLLGEEPLSLDISVTHDEYNPLVETLASPTLTPEEIVARSSATEKLISLIDDAKISKRNKEILCRWYGINGFQHESLEEIGQQFNVTRERARQIVQNALHVLQRKVVRENLSRSYF